MIVPLALKILGSVSAAALAATATLVVIPLVAPPPPDSWLDAPLDGATVSEGAIVLSMHTNIANPDYLRAVIRSEGAADVMSLYQACDLDAPDVTLSDTSPELSSTGADARVLAFGQVQWDAAVGEYDVTVEACSATGCGTDGSVAHITVVEPGPPFSEEPDTDATDPEPIPTDEGPVDEPEDPGTDEPQPDPDPEPDATPTGRVAQQFTDDAKITTWFEVSGITPGSADVTVRVQVVPEGAGYDESSWTTLSCPVSAGRCRTPQFEAGLGGGQRRWGYYQLVLVNGSAVVEGDVLFWQLVR